MSGTAREAPKTSLSAVAATRAGGILILVGLSLVTYEYRRALEPLYGSAPTNLHLTKIVWASCILGSFAPSVPIPRATLALSLLLYALPHTSYWVAVYTGRLGDPLWGPIATHLLVLLPILSMGVAIVKALQEAPYSKEDLNAPQSTMTLPVCATAINALQGLWPAVPYIAVLSENQIFLQLGTVCASFWAIEPFLPGIRPPPSPTVRAPEPAPAPPTPSSKGNKRKKGTSEKVTPAVPATPPPPPAKVEKTGSKLRIALLPLFPLLSTTIIRPPTLPKPLPEPYTHPSYPLQILSSVQSAYSGVVVVGQSLASHGEAGHMDHLRYLRAGHSLLGGVWVGPRAQAEDPTMLLKDEAGETLGDSIYSAFVLQEAARLVKKPGNGTPKNALMIGLGTGIAATSFMRHNLDTTIIEIDPAVYDAAHRFFGLPSPRPEKLFIQDARPWVRNRSATLVESATATAPVAEADVTSPELFDIVVHDCFSGGGVPSHLYTQEFWSDLKNIVRPDGVVAVNFAGMLESASGKAIVSTLQASFPRCRGFYDSLEPSHNVTSEFLNWVFFCTLSSDPLEFRRPVNADYLGSYLRRHVFTHLHEREANVSAVVAEIPRDKREQYVLKDAANPLGDWQQKEAVGHWKIMRGVLPDVFWETY
ncbi:S-adenosyl-L-methionine-dependent methyltransferase [Pilatotrama ljubarskyi]|nr:S-adenosyl-L-methionine-dependent methyltransferase [Pilatotrama ljubarskyi]